MGRKIFVVALVLALLILLPVFSFATNVELSSYDIGDTVQISYSGTLRNFVVVHQGLPSDIYDSSCDGTWLMMENVPVSRAWNSSDVNDFANSSVLNWLNTTFYSSIDGSISPFIKQVKIPYRPGSGYSTSVASGSNGLSTKIFLLSGPEVGWDSAYNSVIPDDGSVLDYFSSFADTDSRRAATNLTGGLVSYWLRDPVCLASLGSKNASMVYTAGDWSHASCSSNYGVRPVFLLPSGLSVDSSGVVLPEYFEQEYSISVSNDGNGSASSDLSVATAGTTVTLTASPNDGYVFSEWQVLQGDISIVNNQFIMPESDVSVKAVFAPDGTHSVTVENDGFGTGSANPVRAEAGTTVTLTAVPVLGYEFDSWEVVSGSVNISSNQFIMPDSDVVVKANFKPVVYTITLNQGSNGFATVSQTTGIIGDVVTLTATPDELYTFSHWEVSPATVSITDNQFSMPAANVTLTPVFIEQTAISSGFEYHSGVLDSESASEYFLIDVSFGVQPAGEYLINIYHWGNGYIPNFQIYIGDKYLPIVSSGSVASVAIEHDGGELVLDGSASFIRSTVGVADGSVFVSSGVGTIYFDKPLSWTFNIEDVVLIPADLANVEDYGMFSTIISFLKGQFEELISVFGSEEAEEDVNEAQESLNQEIEEVNQLSSDLTEQTSNLEQQMTTDFSVSDEVTGQTESVQLIYTGLFSSLGLFSIFIWLPVLFAVIKHLLRL